MGNFFATHIAAMASRHAIAFVLVGIGECFASAVFLSNGHAWFADMSMVIALATIIFGAALLIVKTGEALRGAESIELKLGYLGATFRDKV